MFEQFTGQAFTLLIMAVLSAVMFGSKSVTWKIAGLVLAAASVMYAFTQPRLLAAFFALALVVLVTKWLLRKQRDQHDDPRDHHYHHPR